MNRVMQFADEKRYALGVLAGLSALPLPLNEPRPEGVVGWGFLLLYELGVLSFLLRVGRGEDEWLGNWTLNLLGLLYLPFLLLDVTALSEGQLLRPMMHLAMFVVITKLWSLRRDRDKWQALVAIFFIFVTAMATSASPGIVAYLLVFGVFAVRVLASFANLHLLAADPAAARRPGIAGFKPATSMVMVTVVLAIPLFVLLPRFREPFVLGSGSNSQSTTSGFSDEAGLDSIGRVRTSREVALRLEPQSGELPAELRLRGATFDVYAGSHWERSGGVRMLDREATRFAYQLDDAPVRAEVDVWLEPLGARAFIVPQETVAIGFTGRPPPLAINRGGALGLMYRPARTMQYQVSLASEAVYLGETPAASDPMLDRTGVSPRIAALARSVVGDETSQLAQARSIESHLVNEFEYTLDFVGRSNQDPLAEFLFEYRSGHCEYFASAMVLLLRSLDIPARYVTGFLGAERTTMGYAIVRQSNAHAWVEAYIEGEGWMTFEPTPPDGRPGGTTRSLGDFLRQSYDYLIFRWDRYVITFSQGDQARVLADLRAWVASLFGRGGESSSTSSLPGVTIADSGITSDDSPRRSTSWVEPLAVALLGVGVLLAVLMVVRRPRLDSPRAYRRLCRMAERVGVSWHPAMAPRRFQRQLVEAAPEAEAACDRIVELYIRHSFSGRPLLGSKPTSAELSRHEEELRGLLSSARRAIAVRAKELRRLRGGEMRQSGSNDRDGWKKAS